MNTQKPSGAETITPEGFFCVRNPFGTDDFRTMRGERRLCEALKTKPQNGSVMFVL